MFEHKRMILFVVVFTVMLFSACQGKESDDSTSPIGDYPPDSIDSVQSNPNEITMEVVLYNDKHLQYAAKLYEERTGIKVNIQNNQMDYEWVYAEYIDEYGNSSKIPVPVDTYPDSGAYTERVLTELMTGSGADIYNVSYLDFEQLGKQGLLADMGGWLESDNELTDNTHFRDILLSGKTENSVFAIPIDFGFLRLYAISTDEPLFENRRELWQERMTWEDFFDKITELGYSRDLAYGRTELVIFMYRFVASASSFVDESGNTEALNSVEMISLLEECRDWREKGLLADSRNLATLAAPYSYSDALMNTLSETPYMFCNLPKEYYNNPDTFAWFFAPLPFDGDPVIIDGNDHYPETSVWIHLYGVNESSHNLELAQDFLRFLLSNEMQDKMMNPDSGTIGHIFPVSRAAFRNHMESELEGLQKKMQNRYNDVEDLDILTLTNEAEGIVDQIAYINIQKPYYRTIIYEVAKEFFLDQISAEDAAQQMANKVSLYMKEIG